LRETGLEKRLQSAQGKQLASVQRQLARAKTRMDDLDRKLKKGTQKTSVIGGLTGLAGGLAGGAISNLLGLGGRGTAGATGAAGASAHIPRQESIPLTDGTLALDTATGKTQWAKYVASPNPVTLANITEPAKAAVPGGKPGKFTIHVTRKQNGALHDVLRLDTTTGDVWILNTTKTGWVKPTIYLLAPSSEGIGTWTIRSARNTNTPVVVVRNSRTGKIYADFWYPQSAFAKRWLLPIN
jgi:hypothetical protein